MGGAFGRLPSNAGDARERPVDAPVHGVGDVTMFVALASAGQPHCRCTS
jgi:hypothetical protein